MIVAFSGRHLFVHAAASSWDINTSASYTFDSSKIEFTGGVAQLKNIAVPGTNWYPTVSAHDWTYRQPITIDITGNGSVASGYVVHGTLSGSAASTVYSASLTSGNDFRIAYDNGSTEVDVMRDVVTFSSSSIDFYFKTQALLSGNDSTHYFIYYGNSFASAPTVDLTQIFNNATDAALASNGSVASASDAYAQTPVTVVNDGAASGSVVGMGNNNVNGTRVMIKMSTNQKVWKIAQYWGGNDYGGWGKPAGTYFPPTYRVQVSTNSGAVASDAVGDAKWTSLLDTTDALTVSRIATTDYTPTYPGAPSVSGAIVTTNTSGAGCVNCFGTTLVDTFSPTSALSIRAAYGNTGWLGSLAEFYVYGINATPATAEPTLTFGSQSGMFASDTSNPTIVPNTGQGYSSVSAFTQTLGGSSTGSIQYQISPDDGGSWYWWNGSAWATASGYAQSNTAATVNTNMGTFTAGTNPKTFRWKAFLHSDGTQLPKLDQLDITYIWDTVAPDNPVAVTATSSNGGSSITTNTWHNNTEPYFTWSTPTDNANTGGGEVASGIAGYYVYYGSDITTNPVTGGTFQADTTYTASGMSTGQTYYLRMTTKDGAGNTNGTPITLFTYKFDTTAPTNPAFVSASPAGYSAINSFSFLWPAGTDSMSGLDPTGGYCYKTGAVGATDTCIAGTQTLVSDVASYQTGSNIFYIHSKDAAGNLNSSYVQVTYYYNPDAPSAPQNLAVTPASNTKNSFAFSWDVPTVQTGSVASYRYSINAKPTANNTQTTTATSLAAGPYATQVGENTFYVVGVSDTGVVNYDNPASIAFTATTAAPSVPIAISISDATNRAEKLYALTISWKAPDPLPTDFAGYTVERASSDVAAASIHSQSDPTYAKIAQVTTTIYSDAGLDPAKTYLYRVKSIDSTSNTSAPSSVVSKTPTGKFNDAPAITKGPSIEAKSTSADISWTSDRAGTSLVQCGPTTSYGISSGQLDSVTDHVVSVKGLTPGATYHCRVQTTDVPELVDYSTTDKGFSPDVVFKTLDAPGITDINVSNITLSGAIISWKTNVVATSTLVYGPTLSYGLSVNDQSSSSTTNHAVFIKSLKDSTSYHFRIKSVDAEGNLLQSDDYVFETLKLPVASNIQFQPIKNQPSATMQITWDTNVPTTSIVTYAPTGKPSTETSKAALETKHDVTITNLVDDAEYTMNAGGRDGYGNAVVSTTQHFHTATDSRPPVVSDITVEAQTQGTSDQAKAQLVVTWNTDEASSAQVEYGPGLSSESYPNQTVEDNAYSTSHVVVVSELKAASTYHLRVKSHDKAGNLTTSGDHVVITGRASSSVLNIIIQNLQRSFGWLGTLGR